MRSLKLTARRVGARGADEVAEARRVERGRRSTVRADLEVARRAAEQWGVLSLGELRECGLSRKAVVVRARRGWLHRLHRGIYAVGHPNLPLEGRFLAAVKACGTKAILSHRSAAALWGILDWDERHPEVTVPGESAPRLDGIRAHRTRHLDDPDVSRRQGIPVTAPARTVIDLAADLPPAGLRRATRQAQALHLTSVQGLVEALNRLGPRPGAAKLRRILATGPAPTRSELEDVVLDLILRGGLEHPDVNVPVVVGGRRVVPDFRWPKQRLIVEADSITWHSGKLSQEDDAERQAELEAAGEQVLRVTWRQAVVEPERTLKRFRAAGAPMRTGTQATPLGELVP